MAADGYVLNIPKSVLDQLDSADKKIEQIAKTSQETQRVVTQAFSDMANGINPFINKVKEAGTSFKKSFSKSSETEVGKLANSVAKVSEQLNKVAASPVDTVNKKIESLKNLLNDSTSAVKDLDNQMSSLKSSGSGVISRNTIREASAGTELIPQIQGEIAALEQEKRSVIATHTAWNEYLDTLNQTSLTAQRQKEAMEQLNASFRSGNSELQKRAKATDEYRASVEAAYAADQKRIDKTNYQKEIQAEKEKQKAIRQTEAEKKRADRSAAQSAKIAEKAEESYRRALERPEQTITQRINKISRLRQAQERLTATGRDYTAQINHIVSETNRLQIANTQAAQKTGVLRKQQSRILDTSAQLQRQLALLFSVSAIEGYIGKMVKVRGEFEIQQRSLQAILQNKDEADALFEKTVQLAIKSPYTIKELISYTKQLAAYRIETEKLYDTTKMLADISSGLGVDMQRLILAFGQVKAANYLRGQELRQFSEAGVNILGELADYFTQLEGRMVSVGEVFEMVSKRMISFGDVEKIFQKLTSAGGIFYNMQEIQAETLQGQLANLEDSFDVMFNQIGKANDGVLKGMVSALRSVVENWEIFAVALKTVASVTAIYIIKTGYAVLATKSLTAATIEATIAQGGLASAMAKTVLWMNKAGAWLKANPWVLLATVVLSAGYAFLEMSKKTKEAKAKFDLLTNSIDTQINKFNLLVDKIKKQEQAYKDSTVELGKYTTGTKEYADAEEESNKRRKELSASLAVLQAQYPDVYKKLKDQKNITGDLTIAQQKYNKELRQTQVLNDLMKEDGTNFARDTQKFSESIEENKKAVEKLGVAYDSAASKIVRLMQQGKTNSTFDEWFRQIDEGAFTTTEKVDKLMKLLRSGLIGEGKVDVTHIIAPLKQVQHEATLTSITFRGATDLIEKQYQILEDKALLAARITKEEFQKLDAEEKQTYINTIRNFVNSAAGNEDKATQTFIKHRMQTRLGINIDFNKKQVQKELSDLQQIIYDKINEINRNTKKLKTNIKLIQVEETPDTYFKNLLNRIKELREEENRAKLATAQLNDEMSNDQLAALYKKRADELEAFAKSYGYYTKSQQKGEESAYEKRLKAQLDLLKRLQSEYEKLRKTQGAADAKNILTKEFGNAYQNLFGKPLELDFDKASIAAEMESIAETIGGKAGEELRRAWAAAAAQLRSEVSISVSEQNIADFERKIENMFSGYELSIDLKTQGLDNDLIKQLFHVDVSSLNDIRKALEEAYPDLSKLGQQQLDSYYKLSKMITAAENKELDVRLKDYAKYLKKASSERIRIRLEEQAKLANIPSEFTPDQKEEITKNIKKETKQKLDKQAFDEFKESDMYISMFEDLDKVSTRVLEQMKAKLASLRESLGDLPPNQLKEIVNQMNKIDEQIQSRNPFKDLLPNIKGYIHYLREKKDLESQYVDASKNIDQLEEQKKILEDIIALSEKEYTDAVNKKGVNSKEANIKKLTLNTDKARLKVLNKELSVEKNAQVTAKNGLDDGEKKGEQLKKAAAYASKIASETAGLTDAMNNSLGNLSAGAKDALSSTSEILGGVSNIAAGLAQGPMGYLQAAAGVFETVGAIFAIGDKKRERAIQSETKKVKQLQTAYEDLTRAIENGLSIDAYAKSSERIELLQKQIDSYYRMIEAEQGKKKPDDDRIDEWREAIHDLENDIEDLFTEMKENLIGSFKDLASTLGDALFDAFAEGTNAAESWGEAVHNIVNDIIKRIIIQKLIEPKIKEWAEGLFDEMMPKTSEAEDALERFNKADENIKKWDAAWGNAAELVAKTYGFDYAGEKRKRDKAYQEYLKALEAADGEVPSIDESMANKYEKELNDFYNELNKLPDWIKDRFKKENADLSGLQEGIKSITEDTAQALEALLNSMRFYVADTNLEIKNIRALLSNDVESNPLLAEMRIQTQLIRSINTMFSSLLYAGHPKGSYGLKVWIN